VNYIKSLQQQLAELQGQREQTRDSIERFLAHLHSAKFVGTQQDGSRKDWIATGDVIEWLRSVRSGLLD
jgi:hypothetical protein